MDAAMEMFMMVMAAVGFLVGVGLFFWLVGLGVRKLGRWMRSGRALRIWDRSFGNPETPTPKPDETVIGTARARVNAKEAFDRTTGVFPPFDPRSHQFLHWMRQEWQRAAGDEAGSGDPRVRHAFYIECARIRFTEIVAEGGLTRADADIRMESMRQVLADAELPSGSAVM